MALATGRTMQILRVLSRSNEPLSLAQLLDRTSIARASLTRLLSDLEEDEAVASEGEPPKYRLSATLWELVNGIAKSTGIREIAFPHALDLVTKIHSTVNICVLEDDTVIYFESLDYIDDRIYSTMRYDVYPLLATASGRAIAAQLGTDRQERLFAAGLPESAKQRWSAEELACELNRICELGYATVDREYRDDVSGLAVPLLAAEGVPIGALGLPSTGPLEAEFVELVREPALASSRRISVELGYRVPKPSRLA